MTEESFNTTSQETSNEVEVAVEEKPNNLIKVISELIEQPQQRHFYLFETDTTPHPRKVCHGENPCGELCVLTREH